MKKITIFILFWLPTSYTQGQLDTLFRCATFNWAYFEIPCTEYSLLVEGNNIKKIKNDPEYGKADTLINVFFNVNKKRQWYKYTKNKSIKCIQLGMVKIDDDINHFDNMETLHLYYDNPLSFIKHTKGLSRISAPLKYLELEVAQIPLPRWINTSNQLESLILHLDSTTTSFQMLKDLAEITLPNLKYLGLHIISDLDSFPNQLGQLPSLRGVSYWSQSTLPKNFSTAFNHVVYLSVTELRQEDLEQISKLKHLEYLRFSKVSLDIDKDCTLLIDLISKLPALKYIDAEDCLYTGCVGYNNGTFDVLEQLFPRLTIVTNYHNKDFFRSIRFKNNPCEDFIQLPEKHWKKD